VARRAKGGRKRGSQRQREPSRLRDRTGNVGNLAVASKSAPQPAAQPAQASSDNDSPPKTATTSAPVSFHAAWRGLIKGPLRRRPAALFFFIVLTLGGLSAIVTNVGSIESLSGWLPNVYDVATPWLNTERAREAADVARAREIRFVESLRVGVLETRSTKLLGEPDYHENIGIYNRSFWTLKLQGKPVAIVQTYADQNQNVVMLSVTTLRADFNPTFSWFSDDPASLKPSVTLGKTLLAKVGGPIQMVCANQTNEGEYLYSGNVPSHSNNFQSHIVGVQNSTFPQDFSTFNSLSFTAPSDFRPYDSLNSQDVDPQAGVQALLAQKEIHALMATSMADTYAVTAPRSDLTGADFHIFSLPWIGYSIMSLLLS
jgi:hypothetical protein